MQIPIYEPGINLFDQGERQFALVQTRKTILLCHTAYELEPGDDPVTNTREIERKLLERLFDTLNVDCLSYLGGGRVEVLRESILICGANGLYLEASRQDTESILMELLYSEEKQYLPMYWSCMRTGPACKIHSYQVRGF